MNTLFFFIKRDFKDNLPLWTAPLVLFSMLFTLTLLWRSHILTTKLSITILQICTFLFIFVSATLYGKYLNSVVGTSLQVRTQMSLTRNYLFSLPITRSRLFWFNQVRLLLPLFPFVIFATAFIVTFNPVVSKITANGLFLVGFALSWLLLNYFSWICYLVERSFENRSLTHAFRGFFLFNPILLLTIYYCFLKNIPELVMGGWNPLFLLAFLMPVMMMSLNYLNWLKRE
ncbi:MAG: hypothetical protein R3A80_13445 [Bdellovibrionota bacterium]